MTSRVFFSDPVLGAIFFEGPVSKLINCGELARLRHIKQLSTAHLVFPFAIHSRFHHSIGVAHLVKSFIASLPYEIYSSIEIPTRKILTIAALLHDIGHSAWGHAGEVFASLIGLDIHHETMSKDLIINGNKYDEYFETWDLPRIYDIITDRKERNLITKAIVGETLIDIDKFKDIIDEDNKLKHIEKEEKEKRFLSQLISSNSDFDRIEYLLRDSFYTGVFRLPFSVGGIFQKLGIKNIHNQNQLCYLDRNFGENFTLARECMYASVYHHPNNVLAQEMLGRAWVDLFNTDQINQDFKKLWFSTDEQILEMLKNSNLEYLKYVYNLLRSNRIYDILDYKILSDLDENIRENLRIINKDRRKLLEIEEIATNNVTSVRDLILGLQIKKEPKEMNASFVNYDGRIKLMGESEIIKPLSHQDYVNQRSFFIIGVKNSLSKEKKDILKEKVYEQLKASS
ncbi:MAG: HD domain-containing protein [Promethearchaeota archaeon]